jgi:alkylhydroperoxidase family enzyme
MSRYDEPIARLREASRPERERPAAMRAYLDKVERHAYRVTDADVDALHGAGFSDDEIFEHTVSVAVAAGLQRLDAGLRALP